MNVLITNDDGIGAEGILALEELASQWGTPYVFAPAVEQSGSGHQVTVDRPIAVETIDSHHFAIKGTPADCVRVALSCYDIHFGLVLSGINSGGNLGVDVFMSGTAAAAREASYFGIDSFAISQYRGKDFQANWQQSAEMSQRAIEFARTQVVDGPGFWNVNLPSINGSSEMMNSEIPARLCRLDRSPHRLAYEQEQNGYQFVGTYQDRPRETGADVSLCFGGAITVTRVH